MKTQEEEQIEVGVKDIPPPSSHIDPSKKAAILFGMNYTKCPSNRLRGCHNDAELMEKYLVELRGYDKKNVMKCIDIDSPEDLRLTSTRGMIQSLQELVARSHKDDLEEVFITYSGHGSQVRDFTGREEDGMNEIILPWDFQTGGYISDDTIHNILRGMNPKTRIICIFDCCHSGSIADLEFKYAYDRHENKIIHSRIKHNSMLPNVITLSGCKDCQVSMDAYNVRGRKQFSGAMTACLIRLLRKNEEEKEEKEGVKLFDLFGLLHDLLGDKEFVQMPVLFSSKVLTPEDEF